MYIGTYIQTCILNSRPLLPLHDYMPHAKAFGNKDKTFSISVFIERQNKLIKYIICLMFSITK